MKTGKRVAFLGVLLILAALVGGSGLMAGEPVQSSQAQQAFEKLKSLVGRWEGTSGQQGKKTLATYELASNGSVVVERYSEAGAPDSMMTVYHLDGERLLLTHYCAAGNQPRMQAESFSSAEGVLVFSFLDVTNLSSPAQGHMRKVVFRFSDKDHVVTEWTWRENQADKLTDAFRFHRLP